MPYESRMRSLVSLNEAIFANTAFDKFVYADAVRAVAVLPNLNHLSLTGKTPLLP